MKTVQLIALSILLAGTSAAAFAQSGKVSGGGVMGSSTPSNASASGAGGGVTGSSKPTGRAPASDTQTGARATSDGTDIGTPSSETTTGARLNSNRSATDSQSNTTLQQDLDQNRDEAATGAVINSPSETRVPLNETDNDNIDNESETGVDANGNAVVNPYGAEADVDADVDLDVDVKDRAHGVVHIN